MLLNYVYFFFVGDEEFDVLIFEFVKVMGM